MLTITTSRSAAGAKAYFNDELTKGDYYTEGQQIAGKWHGVLAAKLGLKGDVEPEDFNQMVDNLHPETGKTLTSHQRSNRRAGFDFTFKAPKSLSILLQHADSETRETLLAAFSNSVHETMAEIEEAAAARVRGKVAAGNTSRIATDENRNTNNLAYAEFVHFTARPTDETGGIPDPHLHAHCFVMNATHDSVGDKYKALQAGDIKANAPYYEAAFHARLTNKLQHMGIATQATGKFWEIAGIDRSTLLKFSNRHEEIQKAAEKFGITKAESIAELAGYTRQKKQGGFTQDSLREIWQDRLTQEEKATLDAALEGGNSGDTPITATEALDYALKHHLERNSVIKESQLKEEALRAGFGSVLPEEIKAEIEYRESQDFLVKREIDNKAIYTTRETIKKEQDIINFVSDGYSMENRLNPDYQINPLVGKAGFLSDEQREAINYVLTSRHTVMAIQGKAGVGKTTLMQEAAAGIEEPTSGEDGAKMFTFAPSSDAVDVLKKEGFANSNTVARLLLDEKLQSSLENSVLWVDEAGLLSVNDTHKVFAIAKEQNARVVLSGDAAQHKSVAAGDAFRILQKYADLEPVNIDTIRRQQGEYREAVTAISNGDIATGFATFDRLEKFQEIEDNDQRNKTIATDYVNTITDENKAGKKSLNKRSALVVSPTHKEGEIVTAAIREELKNSGLLKGKTIPYSTYKNLNLTEAQKGKTGNYQEGDFIRFHQKATGIEKGERLRITASNSNSVTVTKDNPLVGNGEELQLDLSQAARFSIYQAESIELQKGDKIRITENSQSIDKKHRLNNGAIYEVSGFTPAGDIKLSNGWVLDKDRGNLTHGYVTTSQSSQGKTVDHVFIAQSADSFGASNQEQFYVSASRGRNDITIYTDDKAELLEQVMESGQRLSAIELVKQQKQERQQQESRKERIFNKIDELYQYAAVMGDRAGEWLKLFMPEQQQGEPQQQKMNQETLPYWQNLNKDRDRAIEKGGR